MSGDPKDEEYWKGRDLAEHLLLPSLRQMVAMLMSEIEIIPRRADDGVIYIEATYDEDVIVTARLSILLAQIGVYQGQPIEKALIAVGWTPWYGAECPVDPNSFPQTMKATGEQDCERASDIDWHWSDKYPHDNIIAYRMI